ncbi:FAD-dependent oxidoreductase [Ramlibacter sp. H39-3-26]|uniref:FAD-dependent oxidoreductase n=1 Tax=Curvibacter soli TaxID=3031331 RepID=UPI0023DC28ED|nr:FAD-dependent oxidoreductase [Ramlibacter sp. H39-3-26]MDF1483998.1 FAD-dependent oxidoreductase [Ramlibacter sp. H39-3-26]
MKIAIVGAGITGVCTAYELAADGHDITVFEQHGTAALQTLYATLQESFPGAAEYTDGVPVVGPLADPRPWLNAGHGANGWAVACDCARLLADLIAERAPQADAAGYAPARFGAA